eukprot:TRINITY_DN11903_c0_g1_i1.p1 TRINITY_DN11903_c0_g1~~TRINITY_DN11903_c0_g1_i1.p1  ORF type:complete len:424 (+),score=110.47 TRINITY_DN11903_c0_g1_i1:81-1352(+)
MAFRFAAPMRQLMSLRRLSTAANLKSEMSNFPGANSRFVTNLEIKSSIDNTPEPCYHIMGHDGQIITPEEFPSEITNDTILEWYRAMNTTNQMDHLLYNAQRQGRISFYMTSYGEEGTHLGSAAALTNDDIVYAQYREVGVLLYRGFDVQALMDQCFSNTRDLGKGRQMPVHYGSREHNFHTISSPLATQLPQAAGAAYAMKTQHGDRCVICYFGDGSASEGDSSVAFNFAATLDCPVVFFCRNNGYAISTPTQEQYQGDGIVSRAAGFGMDYIRVDGNDVFAVYNATKAARKSAIENNRPVLIEAMTYRIGHHSTSDDSSAYRGTDEVDTFAQDTPIARLDKYMRNQGIWDDDKEDELQKTIRQEVRECFAKAESASKPRLEEMFEDVFDVKTARIQKQEAEMLEHLAKYPEDYPLDAHSKA